MNPDLKSMLDDAAASALGPRSLDARALLGQGRARQVRARIRRVGVALAVAAAVVLGLALVPPQWIIAPQPAQPAPGVPGLPRSLPLPTPWTPTVAESPVGRAGLLLRLEADNDDSPWEPGDVGLVLSADGTRYRRLPDGMVGPRLTDDGQYVVYQRSVGDEEYPHVVVHIVRLTDGRDLAVPLPDSRFSKVHRLVVTPDSRTVYATGMDGDNGTATYGGGKAAAWAVDVATGQVRRTVTRPWVITRSGAVYSEPEFLSKDPQAPPLPADFAGDGSALLLSSPDGREIALHARYPRSESTAAGRTVGFVIGVPGKTPRLFPFPPPQQRRSPEIGNIEWIPAGILFEWDHDLRLFDPATGQASLVTTMERPPTGSFVIVDAAYDVVRTGERVAGVTQQDEPPWVVQLLRTPDGVRPESMAVLFGLLGLLGVTLLQLRRRR